jgi:hypothetical protein
MDFTKLVPNVEVNSIQKNINVKNEGVEIFSAICAGKDTSKYGDKVDKVMAYVKNLGTEAIGGNTKSMAELNAIREIMIQSPLLKRLNVFSYMGDYQNVPYDTELRYKIYQLQGKKSGEQANSGSFAFPTQTWREGTMRTKTITGGSAIDYREYASGNVDSLGVINEQVVTDMLNQMFYDVVTNMYTSVRAIALAGGITAFAENAGLTLASVNDAIRLIRRWGTVTIAGSYETISQLQAFTGFTTNAVPTVQFSEAVMEEIRKTGVLRNFRGANVIELENSYNLSRIDATAGMNGNPYYSSYMPEGLMFFMPKTNFSSPLQVGVKGGVTSMSGQSIENKQILQRFDIEFSSLVIDDYVPMLGLLSDSNFLPVDKR